MNAPKPNPWGLTPRQCEVLAAVIETGCNKLASKALGLELRTTEAHLHAAYKRIGVGSRIVALVAFDRWNRSGR